MRVNQLREFTLQLAVNRNLKRRAEILNKYDRKVWRLSIYMVYIGFKTAVKPDIVSDCPVSNTDLYPIKV